MSKTIGDLLFTAAIVCLGLFACGVAMLSAGSDPYAAVRGEHVGEALTLLKIGSVGFVVSGSLGAFFNAPPNE